MEEKEDLKYEIIQLHICLEHLKNAKNSLKDTGEYTDKVYEKIHNLIEEINNLRINKENELIELEEMD